MRLFLLTLFFLCSSQAAVNGGSTGRVEGITGFSEVTLDSRSSPQEALRPELARLSQMTIDPASGEDSLFRTELAGCERCHAIGLHENNSFLPILQGQNEEYLLAKILQFRRDDRNFHPLRSLSRSLSDEQVVAISRYYARQSSTLDKSLLLSFSGDELVSPREMDSLTECRICHGAEGNGGGLIPAISGQNEHYLSYRIREIASDGSRVHQYSLAPVKCQIPKVDINSSKELAMRLALVLDSSRVSRGEAIYVHHCSSCHDAGKEGAPKLGEKVVWKDRVQQGVRRLIRNAMTGKKALLVFNDHNRLSRNQLLNAIHFMIYQAGLHNE